MVCEEYKSDKEGLSLLVDDVISGKLFSRVWKGRKERWWCQECLTNSYFSSANETCDIQNVKTWSILGIQSIVPTMEYNQ